MSIIKSRKFRAAIAGIVAIVAGKIGLNLDSETCGMIAAIVVAYITGQAISDHGVASAQISAAASKTTTTASQSPGFPQVTTVEVVKEPIAAASPPPTPSGQGGRVALAVAVLLAVLGMSIAASSGCHSKRDPVIAATLAAVNESRDAFVALDRRVQAKIVEDASNLEDGRIALARWREQREVVLFAFEAVYRALAVAATEPSKQNVAELLAATDAFRQAYEAATKEHTP